MERDRKRRQPLWESGCNSRKRVKPFQVGWVREKSGEQIPTEDFQGFCVRSMR